MPDRPAITDWTSLLVCPRCVAELRSAETSEALICEQCGPVIPCPFGIPDFLSGQRRLTLAAGGDFDLEDDAAFAARLAEEAPRSTFERLTTMIAARAAEQEQGLASDRQVARDRFYAIYARVEAEVGLRHGQAVLDKVNGGLADLGLPPVAGRWALEGGGGHGKFLPDFSRVFQGVVCLDASLVNLVLSRKLAEQQGLANVRFVRADLTELPFRSDAFAFVHENGVIEHVADPQAMIDEALRVLAPVGTYVCLSPNRFPITPEAHFRLPLYGIFPPALRRRLLAQRRGLTSEAGTDLLSLRRLRRCFVAAHAKPTIFFLPRQLRATARGTLVRRAVRAALGSPRIGSAVAFALNRLLLPIMPYHIAIVSRPDGGPRPDRAIAGGPSGRHVTRVSG